jgi:hypothetical protein
MSNFVLSYITKVAVIANFERSSVFRLPRKLVDPAELEPFGDFWRLILAITSDIITYLRIQMSLYTLMWNLRVNS